MMQFDGDAIARAVSARSGEQKWRPDQTRIVSAICAWYVAHPDACVEYEDGSPGADMRVMVDHVAQETGMTPGDVLASFGAAHCLLCDVVPGFRPVLYSAWDRSEREDHH